MSRTIFILDNYDPMEEFIYHPVASESKMNFNHCNANRKLHGKPGKKPIKYPTTEKLKLMVAQGISSVIETKK